MNLVILVVQGNNVMLQFNAEFSLLSQALLVDNVLCLFAKDGFEIILQYSLCDYNP